MFRSAAAENRTGMYCLGGLTSVDPFNDPNRLLQGFALTVESYQPVSDVWTERGRMQPPQRHSFSALGFGTDGALIVGGQGAVDVGIVELNIQPLASIQHFIAPETWSWAPLWLGQGRSNMATSVIDDIGWLYGGSRSGVGTTRTVFAVRPFVTAWSPPRGELPEELAQSVAGTINSKGYVTSGGTDKVYEWNPRTSAARTGVARLAEVGVLAAFRGVGSAGTAEGDSLYVFGGQTSTTRFSRRTEKYTPGMDIAVTVRNTKLPGRRHSTSFIDRGGVYLIGGAQRSQEPPDDGAGANLTIMNRVERYDVATDTWSSVAPLVGKSDPQLWSTFRPHDARRQNAVGVNI